MRDAGRRGSYGRWGRQLLLVVALVAVSTPPAGATPAHAADGTSDASAVSLPYAAPEVCFAPGTEAYVVDGYTRALDAQRASLPPAAQLPDSGRWSATATNGPDLRQGDATTLTWSIVPDGTPIASAVGEPAAPSNLQAFLNGIYGSPSVWLPLFQQVFDRWAEVSGITYVHQPTDDGAAMFGSPGVLGLRGDVRIGGHAIDGSWNMFAYNYFPNVGDMVLDTSDAAFHDTSNGSRLLRNTIAHEHGHGLGLRHSCPRDGSKIMESMIPLGVDGPQHDDVLGVNRGYGDDLEGNDAAAHASDLGALTDGTVVLSDLSLDDDADVDWFLFNVGPGRKATVTVTPVGKRYPQGPENPNYTCSAGTPFDSTVANDVGVELLDVDASAVLASGFGQPAGVEEKLSAVPLRSGSGAYYVRVLPGTANAAQLYELRVKVASATTPPDDIFRDDFETSRLDAWSRVVSGPGALATSTIAAILGRRGLEAVIDDRAPRFVQDDSPDAESRYRARFSFDPNGFSPGANGKRTTILQAYSREPNVKKLIQLMVRQMNGQYQMLSKVRLDGGSMRNSGWVPLGDAPQSIEIDWRKSTLPERDNGHFDVWVDDVLAVHLTGLDNDQRFLDRVRLGVVVVPRSAGGTMHFDRFVSRRASYIGPP